MGFSETFLKLRHSKKWSVQQVAKKLKVNQSTISRWENGLAEPAWSKMALICKVFGVSISKFVE